MPIQRPNPEADGRAHSCSLEQTTPDLQTNVVYYGDNLDVRRYLPNASVDLVYLDPPFNSNRDSNVIFRDESGNATDAQRLAFEDSFSRGGRNSSRRQDRYRGGHSSALLRSPKIACSTESSYSG